jgi:hypothetical protein
VIATPEDDRRQRVNDPITLSAELYAIQTARGRLDRHADFIPDRPAAGLDAVRVLRLEHPSFLGVSMARPDGRS